MNKEKKFPSKSALLFMAGALLLAYSVVRAYVLSITWDEAYSYIEFVRNRIVFVDKYEMMSANDHILNTWMMIVFTKWFGVSEFVLRIPNLIAHALFIIYSVKLLKNIENKWLALGAFLIVNVNPYMLDFFSVARGYGLSLGLMMVSIYHLYRTIEEEKYRDFYATHAMIFAGLAVFANFVLLNYFMVLFGILLLLYVYFAMKQDVSFLKRAGIFFGGTIVPMIICAVLLWKLIPITIKLREAGAFFFGGDKSFWSSSISTITERSFYERFYDNVWLERVAKLFMFIVLIGATAWTIMKLKAKNFTNQQLFLAALLLILGLSSLSTIVQHQFLGTLYLLDRTVLFLVVLFNLIFVLFMNELSKTEKRAFPVVYVSSGIVMLHFFCSMNFSYVLEWKYDADTKQMLSDLEKIKSIQKEKEIISVGIPMIFDPNINYYRDVNNLTWLNTAWRNETTNILQDYFYLPKQVIDRMNKDSIEIIKTYPATGNSLVKPRSRAKEIKVLYQQKLSYDSLQNHLLAIDWKTEFGPTISYFVNDSITPHGKATILMKAKVLAPDVNLCNVAMVISFHTGKDCYSWQKAYIKDYIKKPMQWTEVYFSCIVPANIKVGDEVKAYIWNNKKQKLHIENVEMKWIQYRY